MRGTLFRLPVMLACVVVISCGKSSPTSPDAPAGGSPSGGSSPTGQTAIASDTVLDDNDWDTVVQTSGPGGTGGGSHLRYNGQVGADYRRINISVNSAVDSAAPAQVAVFSIKRATAYFPTSDGAIFSIDYSEDSILLTGAGNGQYSAPALRQNGKLYTLVQGAGAFPTPERAWTPHSLTGLKQNDFRTLASASEHPDFSASGTRIEWGFVRMNTVPAGSGADNQVGGIDNWRVTMNR